MAGVKSLFALIALFSLIPVITGKPMATPTVFTPLVKGFSWANATTGGGQPLPTGEVETGDTIGIRLDGDTTHAAGNYQYTIQVPAGQTLETPAQITTALGKPLPPGNYWAAIDQTDALGGSSATSIWSTEVPFSIPATAVKPDDPTNFSTG
jgi:hypothetical protein